MDNKHFIPYNKVPVVKLRTIAEYIINMRYTHDCKKLFR